MPKRLNQLSIDEEKVRSDYEGKLSELKKFLMNAEQHKEMARAGEEVLLEQIKKQQKSGAKGTTVANFYSDPMTKKMVDEIDSHKKSYLQICTDYWKQRPTLDTITVSAKGLLTSTQEIVKTKEKQWTRSKSLDDIKEVEKELQLFCAEMDKTNMNLSKLRKPGEAKWAQPGTTKAAKVEDLSTKLDASDLVELMKFVQERQRLDPARAKTHKAIHDRLAALAQANPND